MPVDPKLLDIFPSAVAGLPFGPVDDPAPLTDPALVANAERTAEGLVLDPASGDFAYASVTVLRESVFNDAFFNSWRGSFDEAACSQAGGLARTDEEQIGGRVVFVGQCDGGVLTYHIWLASRRTLISLSSLGDSRLGEQLVAGLTP